MTDNIRAWLHDILSCIEEIESYFNSSPKEFNSFVQNTMLRKAIERNLEIIGEAVNRILKDDPTIAITNARKIVDLRNNVIHGYDVVDHANIWSIVINHLPKLQEEAKQLIKT
jgi:uncharacterized protein with HEPN domain